MHLVFWKLFFHGSYIYSHFWLTARNRRKIIEKEMCCRNELNYKEGNSLMIMPLLKGSLCLHVSTSLPHFHTAPIQKQKIQNKQNTFRTFSRASVVAVKPLAAWSTELPSISLIVTSPPFSISIATTSVAPAELAKNRGVLPLMSRGLTGTSC